MPSFAIVSKLVAAFHKRRIEREELSSPSSLPPSARWACLSRTGGFSPSLSGIVSAIFANCRCQKPFYFIFFFIFFSLSKTGLSLGRRKAGCSIYHHPRVDLTICTVSNHTSYPVCRNNRSRLASCVHVFWRGHRL